MRIPLDYYRILGLPIQATGEHLRQAHRDRTLQLPRKEYSAVVIEARKQLLDEAYAVLSDEGKRRDYDGAFLAKTFSLEAPLEVSPGESEKSRTANKTEVGEATLRSLAIDSPPLENNYAPTIDIEDTQFVGALLLLLELGEYELVIRLGRPYLSSGFQDLRSGRMGDPQAVLSDTVLTLALACLELGREQWQQRQYEIAAESLETGHELLIAEGLFPSIRAEIQTELYKLRPYRVLELLSRPLDQTRERRQGLKLLKGMLEDRGGIEGTDDDLSRLSTDDFLRFIQQLRDYLTATEQQELFEEEARRPSAVAIYLTVYALLARGFARHQPALVRRAKQLLMRIGVQQDVRLEQAVCALLLGQTEEASHALELSQEYEPLAFIRENSQGAPDLLPGLCMYAERWLRDEVFLHFRDLREQSATLKNYFADPQVQTYLETMPREAATLGKPISVPTWERPAASSSLLGDRELASQLTTSPSPEVSPRPANPFDFINNGQAQNGHLPHDSDPDGTPSIAERVAQLSPEGQLKPRRAMTGKISRGLNENSAKRASGASGLRRPRRTTIRPRWDRLGLVFVIGLLGMGALGFLTSRALSWVSSRFSGPQIEGEPLAIRLDRPPIAIPPPPAPEEHIGVEDIAERAVNSWLAAKREALGPQYNIDSLQTILAEPLLMQWQRRAEAVKRDNTYWEYEHTVTIQSVDPPDPAASELQTIAEVREVARFFELGVENDNRSYNDVLTMRYDLVRQNEEWRVQEMTKMD